MRVFFLLILAACLLIAAGVTSALSVSPQPSGPHFSDIIVTTSETHLLLFGELRNSITPDMIEGLHSGIPIRFTFFVELERTRPNWFNVELASQSFSHTLTYDTLKQVYVVETNASGQRRRIVPSLEEAQTLLNEINGLRIIELAELVEDTKYRLRLKAELHKKTLPLSLHAVVPFISWWDLNTDWYTVEFMY